MNIEQGSYKAESREKVPSQKRSDRGALLAAALFASIYPTPTDNVPYTAPGAVQLEPASPPSRPEKSPVREQEQSEDVIHKPVIEAERIYWSEARTGRRFNSFIEGLIEHARTNSGVEGRETARIYVTSEGGREQILDAENIASSSAVEIDYDAVWEAFTTNGAVLICHTHPLREQFPGIERQVYVSPPSTNDIELLLNDIDWLSRVESVGEERGEQYNRHFTDLAQRVEQCVATPGQGYWRMRVADSRTARAWVRENRNDRTYQEGIRTFLRPLSESAFHESVRGDQDYRRAFRNEDVSVIAMLVERDLLGNRLQGEAKEAAERFIEAYQEFNSNRDFDIPGAQYQRLNEVRRTIFDTADSTASEEEYLAMQAEVLRLYGIQMEWVRFGDEPTESVLPELPNDRQDGDIIVIPPADRTN